MTKKEYNIRQRILLLNIWEYAQVNLFGLEKNEFGLGQV